MKFVTPRVFLTGFTNAYLPGIHDYLKYTGQTEFMEEIEQAIKEGISGGEALCSFYAKLCYASLVVGKNANISKVRAIVDNLIGTHTTAHGSVFEHASINFVATDCSRVFTHELVRHRIGTAFSQTSGRYCRPMDMDGAPQISFVHDPILNPVKETIEMAMDTLLSAYRIMEIKMGLISQETADTMRRHAEAVVKAAEIPEEIKTYSDLVLGLLASYEPSKVSFDEKKKLTSALRRILPNGQANEIGFSANIRTLRHCMQLRTSRFAEWEIRDVFYQIYQLVKDKFPMVFYGAKEREVPGSDVPEIWGMRLQPYDLVVADLPSIDLLEEVAKRKFKFSTATEEDAFRSMVNSALHELQEPV